MRFHRQTPSFARVLERLEASDFRDKRVMSQGHLWLPLSLPAKVSGAEIVQDVVRKAEKVIQVVYADPPSV